MKDVVIIGAGPAGSSLAILLGQQGKSVTLIERGQFPREKPCGEGLMPAGVAILERLGVKEAVGGVPFLGVRYHASGSVATGRFPSSNGHRPTGIGQRRRRLDHALFQAAAATPGVTALTGAPVESLLRENGRLAGVVAGGAEHRAQLVVGADGAQSRVRALLGWNRPQRRKRVGMRAHFRLAPGQPTTEWVDIFVAPGHELYVTLLPHRELLVAALAGPDQLNGSPASAFHRWRGEHRALAARLEGAEQVSELLTTSPLSGSSRHGVAPGVVLLGDAAGFCDPLTGGGMAHALASAELLAGHIARHGVERQEWLARFDRERRRMLRGYARLTEGLLWLTGHPRVAERAVAVASRAPRVVSHLVGVAAGMRRLAPFGNAWHA